MSGSFLATFSLVLVAEIGGDKLLYTTGVLATRYAPAPIVFGIGVAFMAKMGAAVLIGAAISRLSPFVVVAVTSLSFLGVAYSLWRTPDSPSFPASSSTPNSRVALVSFATVLFAEWGDVGQITAATLAAQYRAPFMVWLGAVCAMLTKGVLAASVGAALRNWVRDRIPPIAVRLAATAAMLVMGLFSAVEILGRRH